MRPTKFSDPPSLSLLIEYDRWAETVNVELGCAIGTEDFPMSIGSSDKMCSPITGADPCA